MGNEYELRHAFMNQSKDFAFGFEMGILWTRFKTTEKRHVFAMLHEKNKSEALRLANTLDWSLLRWRPVGDGWARVWFRKAESDV